MFLEAMRAVRAKTYVERSRWPCAGQTGKPPRRERSLRNLFFFLTFWLFLSDIFYIRGNKGGNSDSASYHHCSIHHDYLFILQFFSIFLSNHIEIFSFFFHFFWFSTKLTFVEAFYIFHDFPVNETSETHLFRFPETSSAGFLREKC